MGETVAGTTSCGSGKARGGLPPALPERHAALRAPYAALRSRYEQLTVRAATAIATAVAAVATLSALGRQPLSWDEATTLRAARLPLGQLARLVRHTDAPMTTYYLLMHGWLAAFSAVGISPDETLLRLPSALAAIAAVALLVRLAADWFDPRVAVLAGVLLALHPMLTFYAQDARPYTLVVLAFLAGTLALRRALADPTAARFALYGALVALTIYLHLFAVYALAAHAALVWLTGAAASRRRWLLTMVAVGVAVLPLVALARSQTKAIGWIPKPTPSVIASVLSHLLGGVGLVGVLVVAVALLVRNRPTRPFGFVVAWLLLPAVILVAVDFSVPDLVARYALVAIPALTLLIALAATRSGRIGSGLAVVALVTAMVTTLVQQSAPYKYEDYRAATDVVLDTARPGAAVVFMPQSMRDGYLAYADPDATSAASEAGADADSDGKPIADPFLAPPAEQALAPRLGGVELPAIDALGPLSRAPEIFLYGYTLTQASRVLTGAADVAKERFLRGYRVQRVDHFGGVSVTVLTR